MGRIEGFGLTGDASGPGRLDPSSDGWLRSFGKAIEDAEVTPPDVDLVVSAACGRAAIDDIEASAIRDGGLSASVVSMPKAIFGDAGSSSALLGVVQALWMRHETDAGTFGRGCESPGRPEVRRALVSSYEVGGSYQSVVIRTDDT
jgi:3-oxoacyl-[acyl-carrier-protein] synthase II